jgi:gamma-glutamyltranspeptidase
MYYSNLNINQKINAKGNAKFFYTGYNENVLVRIVKKAAGLFNPEYLKRYPDTYREPSCAGNPKY